MDDRKTKIDALAKKLEQGIKDVFTSERWREYLSTAARFHNYSYSNTLLILSQKPDATYVAGFNSWRNWFGRTVNKGEKGIEILAPAPYKHDVRREVVGIDGKAVEEVETHTRLAFKIVHVFDVSQTSGKEMPRLIDELQANVAEYVPLVEALKKVSAFPVEFRELEGTKKGFCSFTDRQIVVKQGMSEAQTIKTLLHEMAHACLHGRDTQALQEGRTPDRRTQEVEAESIAYMVGQFFGVDSSEYTFGYVASWSGGKELPELKQSLATIQSKAHDMIEDIRKEYAIELSRHVRTQAFEAYEAAHGVAEGEQPTAWDEILASASRAKAAKQIDQSQQRDRSR